MKYLKEMYKDLILVLVYIILADIVYVSIAQIIWGQWYLSLLVGIAITLIGSVIGFFYLKNERKDTTK
ncbi:MAG: hypothetical protein ACI35S_07950 [Anaeroplasma sp.]